MSEPEGSLRPLPDRRTAGKLLAERLRQYREERPVVLALPRGGVPVGFEIATRLGAPLDVLIVRKIGAPGNPEYGLGAVVEGGTRYLDEPRVRAIGHTVRDLGPSIARETAEVERRAREFREGRPPPEIRDRTVILVDDGVATGGTVLAALRALRARGPRRIVVALGVAPPDTVEVLRREVDDLVVLLAPRMFFAVGEWYHQFSQVSDEEVRELLERSRGLSATSPS
ncbi:MAG TPA: phosphoribosyltransferase family protein [Thermoplasmata archaeon]|jgi:putative phosphoribosyl transferase|nr:phosphoribosyltransferase family protein [Thermoplasmata archaeon]